MKSLTLFRSEADLNNIILAVGISRTYYRDGLRMNSFANIHPSHLNPFQYVQLNLKEVK